MKNARKSRTQGEKKEKIECLCFCFPLALSLNRSYLSRSFAALLLLLPHPKKN